MNKKYFYFLTPLLLLFRLPLVMAHCPLCTAAVGAAAISANYYGMDVSIIGLLIGAFGVSTGLWFGLKIKTYFKFQLSLIVLVSFLLTIIPLLAISNDTIYVPMLYFGTAGSLLNKVYWFNKMLFGGIVGGIMTLISYNLHNHIKKVNGRVLVPYQGIIFTVTILAITSTILFFYFR